MHALDIGAANSTPPRVQAVPLTAGMGLEAEHYDAALACQAFGLGAAARPLDAGIRDIAVQGHADRTGDWKEGRHCRTASGREPQYVHRYFATTRAAVTAAPNFFQGRLSPAMVAGRIAKSVSIPDEDGLRALLLLALAGDNAAYASFLGHVGARLRGHFRCRTAAFPDDVEDLVQEAMLAIHNQRHTYRSEQSLTAWLYAIAR